MHKISVKYLALILAFVFCFPVFAKGESGILNKVKARGRLVCGVHSGLPGFSFLKPDGTWNGFDADYCRAIAAAVLGDPKKVEFVPLTAAERFTALQTGEIDVLIRNTTRTLTRDTQVGADFAPTTFYDGQGFMVRKSAGVRILKDLAGASICVTSGTTTELNLADTMRNKGVSFKPVVFDETDTVYKSYEKERCDAVTSDKSQLAARRSVFKNPDDHVILDATISKEPLGPLTVHGDNGWNDVVSWVVYATFFAEEHNIISRNVKTFQTRNPEVQRFLGTTGDIGKKLGLSNDWAVNVIAAIGNYGECFERNLAPIGLPRGINKLWNDGGLLYPMPFR